jgi:hypothetical protein
MSDFFHFVCWFACVFASAIFIAGFIGDHWYFQSAAISLLLPLCISLTLGSLLVLGIWKLRALFSSYLGLTQGNTMVGLSHISRAATGNKNLKSSRFTFDYEAKGGRA